MITVDANDFPYRYEVTTPPGDSYEQRWRIYYDPKDGSGPRDMTMNGCTLALTISKGEVVVTKSVDGDAALTFQFTELITAAEAAAFDGDYYSKVVCVFPVGHDAFPNGATKTLLVGKHKYYCEV